MIGDLVVIDVEPHEDGLVQQASVLRPGSPVELLGVVEQVERSLDERSADLQAVVGVLQLLLQVLSLGADLAQSGPQLVLRSAGITGEVEQVVFLPIELGQVFRGLLAEQFGRHHLVVESLVQLPTHCCGELLREADASVVVHDGILDVVDLDVARDARSVLFPAAEEVEVFAAVTPDGSLHEQAAVMSVVMALSAPDAALEVVGVLTEAFTSGSARFENGLDTLEQIFADKRLMTALVHLAAVGDDADVVGVTQHGLNFRC